MVVKVAIVQFEKSDFESMPPVERDFLIMCGHISNEILILGKTIMASQNFPTEKIAPCLSA